MKKTFALLFLMLASLPSLAFTPESGLYWDSSEPGSGYNFEIQDNFFFGVFYVYDDFGNPFWYTTSGFMDGNSYFEGPIYISEDGPCLACSWRQNSTFQTSLGTVEIDFLTETSVQMSLLGKTLYLDRFNFYLGNELQKMRGEWQLVYDISAYSNNYPYYGDVLIFEQTETYNGDDLVTGCRSESTVYNRCTNYALNYHDLAAAYDYQYDELIAVVRDDDNYYLAYYLKTGTNQFDGEAFSYRVGSSPNLNQAGFTVRGFRSASKHFVDSGVGPSKSTDSEHQKHMGLNQMLDSDRLKNAAVSKLDKSTQNRILATIAKLEKQLQ